MNVIRRLRVHLIISIVSVLMAVLAVILITLNIILVRTEHADIEHFTEILIDNGGMPPAPPMRKDVKRGERDAVKAQNVAPQDMQLQPPDEPTQLFLTEPMVDVASKSLSQLFAPRLFGAGEFHNFITLRITTNNMLCEISRQFNFFHSQAEMYAVVSQIMAEQKERGFYDYLYYRIAHCDDGSRLLAILNCQSELAMLHRMYYSCFFIWLLSLLVALIAAWFLSDRVVRPVEETFIRQKTFISDAGHELKTPIAVIAANVDVLLPEYPNNRWLQYIKSETDRMNRLVKDLLFLARDDAGKRVMQIGSFSLSNAIENAVLPFESIIFEQGKTLEYEIQPDISFTGDEQQIKQVVIILTDNAIKNSDEGALIRVTMKQEAQKAVIRVYNTGMGIKEDDLQKIFLRFYRSDISRARKTGGYGLGLAIAKSISDAHDGTLSVDSKYGEWAEFTFTLPLTAFKEKQNA